MRPSSEPTNIRKPPLLRTRKERRWTRRSGGRAKVSESTSGKGVNNVRDKIQLKSRHWPSREELLKKAAEGLVSRCLTVEASFDEEEEVLVIGHADSELRDYEVAMRLQVIDGTSQEKFLYLLAEIEEEARNHWERFRLFAVLDGRLTK
jgi:hypothetical protein